MNADTPKVFGLQDPEGQLRLYHQGEENVCPGCGWAQWWIGNAVAECARCRNAIPLCAPVAPELPNLIRLEKEAA